MARIKYLIIKTLIIVITAINSIIIIIAITIIIIISIILVGTNYKLLINVIIIVQLNKCALSISTTINTKLKFNILKRRISASSCLINWSLKTKRIQKSLYFYNKLI